MSESKIEITYSNDNHTVTIKDNGIGMSREEVISNLGTIAKSGTKEFLASLSESQTKDTKMIGQFGVGFYSSFIVAKKVTVKTRRAGSKSAIAWSSTGGGEYTIADIKKMPVAQRLFYILKT